MKEHGMDNLLSRHPTIPSLNPAATLVNVQTFPLRQAARRSSPR